MKLLNILSEIVLINENLAMAKKWLMKNNIPEDDPDFVKVKDYLAKNNSLGYLGYVLKFVDGTNYSLNLALQYAEYILENKEFIKLLPKDIANYNSFVEFRNDIDKLKSQRKIKNLTKKLTNKNLIAQLLQSDISEENLKNIEYFLSIESGDQKEFLSKTDKYNDVETFLIDLDDFLANHRIGFKYDIVLDKIKSMSDDDIKVLLNQNNMILAIIKTYKASAEIGSKSWCIVGDEHTFNEYTKNGENYQYFFFNFNYGIQPNLKMIAFTMNADNEITVSHDRYDNPFNSPLKYLKTIGVSDKVFMLNSREFFKRLLNKKFITRYGDVAELNYQLDLMYDNKKEVTPSVNFNISLETIASNVFSMLKKSKGNHLDLIIKKFENYPVKLITYNQYGGENKTDYGDYNILVYMIDNYDNIEKYSRDDREIYSGIALENVTLSKDEFINILEKIYQSSINIEEETKRKILLFLKENGVDILKLTRLKKAKRGEDLTPSEFGMLAKQGENLVPIIQSKLGAIRRGEDVSMSETEINYAIDNGYKNIIMKYYKNNLPYYYENQLTYEDLNIYKKLGMFNDIKRVIVSKGNYWGQDTLNSIENSVYNMSKMSDKTPKN